MSGPGTALPPHVAAGPPWEAPFEALPPGMRARAFGVDYAHVRPAEGGDLYLTPFGWPLARHLLPGRWYADRWYATAGEALPGASGHVYHVRTRPLGGRAVDLVVKFSRMAQEVSVVIDASLPEDVPHEVLAEARYNSPMEEFGLVMELRRAGAAPGAPRVRTQRPLAIYAPPESFDLWELGRSACRFLPHHHQLAEDQGRAMRAIELDIKRIYVLLYGWIAGADAEDCHAAGLLPADDFRALMPRVTAELERLGYRVLDNKPRHYILRARPAGGVLRDRAGRPVYGLVDFEFLQRTREHQRRFEAAQRERYWRLHAAPPAPASAARPAGPPTVRVLGETYLFTTTPDGGQLFVHGRDPALADYFLPDRWRRTPRTRLSEASQVYRTRTRDHIHVVYRLSRVGVRPLVDPLSSRAARIREHGYNSPFEEVAIAERLREMGIGTTVPRAIYRTGHETVHAPHLRDPRRFEDHAALVTPEDPPGPVLSPRHDYYTIWDAYRGGTPWREPGREGMPGTMDLARAVDDALIAADEAEACLVQTRARLERRGLPSEGLDREDLLVELEPGGAVRRTAEGVAVILGLDALTAYEYGLLDDEDYRAVVRRMDERLRAADFEKLDPNGRHLLLTMDPDGRIVRTDSGEVLTVLCNFALVRSLYRPLR
uniref:Uncharacterized protein n=1 Tax=Eiseniibacteriota bacterium TaxID=2212470 RepID=A0A832HZS4_UNCEI